MGFPYSSGDVLSASDLNASSGLVLVKTQTIGSGVSSVTVTGAFSATFDNYRIMINVDNSVTAGMLMTLNNHASGNYYYSKTETSWAGVINCFGGAAQNDFAIGSTRSGNGTAIAVQVMNPNRSEITAYSSESVYFLTTGYSERIQGWHNSLSQATSVTVFPSSGTISGGTIRVYGYNNG